MTDRLYLGRTESEGLVYLSKHSWDCNWYWGFGYLGNKNCHFHIESLLGRESDVTKIFTEPKLSQKAWWVVRDLFVQAYALKDAAAVYRYGGYQSASKGITDVIKSKELEDRLNKDLETILNTVWKFIEGELNDSVN